MTKKKYDVGNPGLGIRTSQQKSLKKSINFLQTTRKVYGIIPTCTKTEDRKLNDINRSCFIFCAHNSFHVCFQMDILKTVDFSTVTNDPLSFLLAYYTFGLVFVFVFVFVFVSSKHCFSAFLLSSTMFYRVPAHFC